MVMRGLNVWSNATYSIRLANSTSAWGCDEFHGDFCVLNAEGMKLHGVLNGDPMEFMVFFSWDFYASHRVKMVTKDKMNPITEQTYPVHQQGLDPSPYTV